MSSSIISWSLTFSSKSTTQHSSTFTEDTKALWLITMLAELDFGGECSFLIAVEWWVEWLSMRFPMGCFSYVPWATSPRRDRLYLLHLIFGHVHHSWQEKALPSLRSLISWNHLRRLPSHGQSKREISTPANTFLPLGHVVCFLNYLQSSISMRGRLTQY